MWYIGIGGVCVIVALLLTFVGLPFTEITDYESCVKMGGETMNNQCMVGSIIYSKLGTSVDLENCESYFDGCNTCFIVDGKLGGCTLMACENYEAPKCLKEKRVGLANPASTNCVENGGVLEIVDGEDGQYGLCKFDDGSICEEWAFMRGECKKGDAKIDLTNCESYFDGCNTCFVKDGIVGGCTRMYCSPEMMEEPKCLK